MASPHRPRIVEKSVRAGLAAIAPAAASAFYVGRGSPSAPTSAWAPMPCGCPRRSRTEGARLGYGTRMTTTIPATVATDPAAVRRRLHWVAVVAVADFILLVPLFIGLVTGHHGLAPVLGPVHGIGFLVELYLAGRGAVDRDWGWWFPAVVLVSGGPLGALIGHRVITRGLDQRT